MANSVTHASTPPIYGALHTIYAEFRTAAGVATAPTSLDSELSLDGGTFADATNEVTLIKEVGGSTDSPYGYLTLTAAEMTADAVVAQLKSSNCVTIGVNLKPERIIVAHSGTAQAGANTTITLASGASELDDIYNGMYIRTTGGTGTGQARQILDYVGSTRVATVRQWETNPSSDTTYEVGPIQSQSVNASRLDASIAAISANVPSLSAIWTTVQTESYMPADENNATPVQLLYMIFAFLTQKDVVGTTVTARKRDGDTQAMIFTLNDASNPTSIRRTG